MRFFNTQAAISRTVGVEDVNDVIYTWLPAPEDGEQDITEHMIDPFEPIDNENSTPNDHVIYLPIVNR